MIRKIVSILLSAVMVMILQTGFAQRYRVADNEGLKRAVSNAKPGDSIVLANGVWNNVALVITAHGSSDKPIVIMAEKEGGVDFSGNSFIRFGSDYVIVSGIYFRNGFTEKGAIVEFRKSDNELANNCRLTHCAIGNFSKPDRAEEDHWIILWGKKNRIDHCVIGNKLNGGTTIIAELNDARSQQNEHSIDSNYFKGRQPLGANGGEIIRIGVSRYSLTNSSTLVHHNYFERCNGEVEIISVKSGNNRLTENTFYECEGGLVLRHGANNTVLNNVFIGNGKPYTGGVRVINPGHTVANNLFVGLAGTGFHGGFTVVNGVPNSPLNRYLQVTDVDIHHNTFVHCKTILFGAGKDNERILPPARVTFRDNLILSNSNTVFEDANKDGGIRFNNNVFSGKTDQQLPLGFIILKPVFSTITFNGMRYEIPVAKAGADLSKLQLMDATNTGVSWADISLSAPVNSQVHLVSAAESRLLPEVVKKAKAGDTILLTDAAVYPVTEPLLITKNLVLKAKSGIAGKPQLVNVSANSLSSFLLLENTPGLHVENIIFNSGYENYGDVKSGISTVSKPMSLHYALTVTGCEFINFTEGSHICIRGSKGTYADSVLISDCLFKDNAGVGIDFGAEKDDKGIYNIGLLRITNTAFVNMLSGAVNVYRGGNDESTTGPFVIIDHCTFNNVENRMQGTVLKLIGVQVASVTNSIFHNSGKGGRVIWFEEMAWDRLNINYCNLYNSGRISTFFNKAKGANISQKKTMFVNDQKNDCRLAKSVQLAGSDGKPMGIL
ncbi:TonB-dependent receptor [Pseudoflavitalea sp. G-6-1-2]|uniref:polysaccharide lyase 6 family protein n=1 Tax=Pseudoflavitalea sp. G-6-1-2 TaxID=2728841 RepID=UPI00146EFE22|nr:polysaccharide lyase 6 family protein [Pseudoflavitalea sp. G-6-1-2]NML21638.1 TonB-dependent receptor [Pseudoflavitalea sp. G-6-1-2]